MLHAFEEVRLFIKKRMGCARFGRRAGQVIVADGTKEPAAHLQRVLTADPATGIFRHVDAGYEIAARIAHERGIRLPGQ